MGEGEPGVGHGPSLPVPASDPSVEELRWNYAVIDLQARRFVSEPPRRGLSTTWTKLRVQVLHALDDLWVARD